MAGKAAAALLVVLVFASHAAAQTTRAAELERQRAEKATRLKPYEPTKVEIWIRRAEDVQRRLFPHNGLFVEYGYTHKPVGSGIGVGGGWRHDLFGRRARVELEGGISWKNYQMVRADFSLPQLARRRLELGVEATYRRQPQDDFYGLGSASIEDDRVNYLYKGRQLEGRAVFSPQPWFQIGTRLGWLNPTLGRGTDSRYPSIEERFQADAVPGLALQPDYRYTVAFAAADTRDEPGNARAGGLYTIAWSQHSDLDFGRYSFRQVGAHARHFFPIFDKKRVIAVQAQAVSTGTDAGHEAPFFFLPTIGGSHTVRSLNDFRFRDRSLLNLNLEYRWEAFGALDMALFTDMGQVAPRLGDVRFGDMKRAYGVGFRFNTATNVFFRFDVATGAGEGVHYYFKFNNAF